MPSAPANVCYWGSLRLSAETTRRLRLTLCGHICDRARLCFWGVVQCDTGLSLGGGNADELASSGCSRATDRGIGNARSNAAQDRPCVWSRGGEPVWLFFPGQRQAGRVCFREE